MQDSRPHLLHLLAARLQAAQILPRHGETRIQTAHIGELFNYSLLLPMFQSSPRSLDLDDLDQRFLMKDNTMMFLFHDPEFFSYLFSQDDTPAEVKYGRFLQVDFSEYVKTGGEIKMRLDNEFDNNRDYIEKICLNSLERMTCILSSGKIVVRDLVLSSQAAVAAQDKLTIEAAEPLQEDYDEELDEEVPTHTETKYFWFYVQIFSGGHGRAEPLLRARPRARAAALCVRPQDSRIRRVRRAQVRDLCGPARGKVVIITNVKISSVLST